MTYEDMQALIDALMEVCGTDDPETLFLRVQYDRLARLDAEYNTYSVYVQVNADDYVTAIDSNAFITDPTMWVKVDEGVGELYKYARVNYCPAGLEANGGHNYKLVAGKVVYCPEVDPPEDHNEISPQEQFFVASRNYAAGELVTVQGRLYEVISPIPAGCSIVIGENVVETTLSDYINTRTEG